MLKKCLCSLLHAPLLCYLMLQVTTAQTIDSLYFDLLLKHNFVNDYKELSTPASLVLKKAIETKFNAILTSFSREFKSSDVIRFQNQDGKCLVTCKVTFSAPLDLAMESLFAFHVRALLGEAGWKILTENGLVEIQAIFYKIMREGSETRKSISVPLSTADKCIIFNQRDACKNGGTCHLEEGNPVCWCPRHYIGTYCEDIYTASNLELRLVGGGFSWGFLEVTNAHRTGVVCASDWAEATLQVTCRQLGFQGGQRLSIPETHLFSASTVLLNHVRCFGNETNLGWCLHSQAQSSACAQEQQLIVLCSDVTDVMKFSVIVQEKSQNRSYASKRPSLKVLRDSVATKFNSMLKSIQDFSFTDVLSLRETSNGLQIDFQIMYNHRMGPVRQAVALHSLAKLMEAEKGKFTLYADTNLALKNFYLTSTNNNAQFKLNVSLLKHDLCQLLNVKKSCMNGGQCKILDNTPYCKCPDGFTGSFCEEDLDECSKKSDCAQICENIVGGYLCHCNATFKSYDEGRVCEQMALPVKLSEGGLGWGRVEVSNLGQWGSVCIQGWNNANSEVVCKELGFPGAYASFHADAILKPTTKPVWLRGLSCLGTEKTLEECDHGRWSVHDCKHDLDVGLICNHVISVLQFEMTLGVPWISEYESSEAPLSMNLRQDLQDLFSDLFVEHSSSDGLGSVDVFKFRVGPDGSTIAFMEVLFEYQLDVTSQSLAAFFLFDAVKEAGGQFQMPSLPVTVPIKDITVKTQDSHGKTVKVVLSESNRCALFDIKASCLRGSYCVVEGTVPVCKCPQGREGLYCERVPLAENALTTPVPSYFYMPLVTEQHRLVMNMAVVEQWRAEFSSKNDNSTMGFLHQLEVALRRSYRGAKDQLVKIAIVKLYPTDGGIGFLHIAEFQHNLSPADQADIATRFIRDIEDHDNCILLNHNWARVILGPTLRYPGKARDTFSEVTMASPCSLHNERSLCLNGGYCIDSTGLPQCFCNSYFTGVYCEIDLGSTIWFDFSVLTSYLTGMLFVLLGFAVFLKVLQTFRHIMHRHILSDYNANIISAKAHPRYSSPSHSKDWHCPLLPSFKSSHRHP